MLPELRPRGIGELLDTGVALYRARIGRLLGLTALVIVPVQVINVLVLLSARPDKYDPTLGINLPVYDTRQIATEFAANIVVLLLTLVSTAFVTAACTRVVADAYIGHDDPSRDFVRVAARRILPIIGLGLIIALAEAIGFVMCFVGYFAAIGFFAVAVPALILERLGVFAAIGRSFNLTKNNFWRVLGTVFSAQVLGSLLTVGLTAGIAFFLLRGAGPNSRIISQGIASAISTVITTPFTAAVIVAVYFDLRVREEAFDVQLMLQRLDARSTPPPPPPTQPAFVP